MTYFEHMQFSLTLAAMMMVASGKAIAHALVPSVCITSSSDAVREMAAMLQNSGCVSDKDDSS